MTGQEQLFLEGDWVTEDCCCHEKTGNLVFKYMKQEKNSNNMKVIEVTLRDDGHVEQLPVKALKEVLSNSVEELTTEDPCPEIELIYFGDVLQNEDYLPKELFLSSEESFQVWIVDKPRKSPRSIMSSKDIGKNEDAANTTTATLPFIHQDSVNELKMTAVKDSHTLKPYIQKSDDFNLREELESIDCGLYWAELNEKGYHDEGAFAGLTAKVLQGNPFFMHAKNVSKILKLSHMRKKRLEKTGWKFIDGFGGRDNEYDQRKSVKYGELKLQKQAREKKRLERAKNFQALRKWPSIKDQIEQVFEFKLFSFYNESHLTPKDRAMLWSEKLKYFVYTKTTVEGRTIQVSELEKLLCRLWDVLFIYIKDYQDILDECDVYNWQVTLRFSNRTLWLKRVREAVHATLINHFEKVERYIQLKKQSFVVFHS